MFNSESMIVYIRSLLAFMLLYLLALLAIPLNTQTGYSQNPTLALNETSVHTPSAIKGSYELPGVGFSITFPKGWSGVNHGFIAMVSPDGINQFNGNLKRDQNKSLMVIEVLNNSDFQDHKYESEIQKNCRILSEKFFVINAIQTKEVFIICGVGGNQKIVNYIFGSENKIIIVGLKGTGNSFDNNLDAFRNSIRTVMIKNPIEIKQMPNISSQT
jgi:hypothetical protein